MQTISKYLYILNYPTFEGELCHLEMRSIFGKNPTEKTIFSEKEFNPSSSPFIKYRLDILFEIQTLEELLSILETSPLEKEEFKVEYMRLNDSENISYEERIRVCREIGLRIVGFPNIKNPKITFGITKFQNRWFFGISQRNDYRWNEHYNKPCSYSNSLGVKTAKALVNIAGMGNLKARIVDPCCGVGTTLVEALEAGYDISGYELNSQIAHDANTNLVHYGFHPIVINRDMHTIEENYDASIIDIPYGIFSHTSEKEQQGIIDTAHRISKRMVIISFEDHDKMIQKAGFKIIDSCIVTKGQFKRYIRVCQVKRG